MLQNYQVRLYLHYLALALAFLSATFVINNYLTYIFNFPGMFGFLETLGLPIKGSNGPATGIFLFIIGAIQTSLYLFAIWYPLKRSNFLRKFKIDNDINLLNNISNKIVLSAFWSVMLIGFVDATISFLRIEGFLPSIVGDKLALELSKPSFRGIYVHLPLFIFGTMISFYRKNIDFIWLASLIVIGELLIVISRFIFSYEQAFMGDLVRFWYGALFLFSSAYTLVNEGHVRVDVIYASFDKKQKALTNIFGSFLLGMPLCWVILTNGMWFRTSPLNMSLLNFEVTQQGFGMYVKYIMSTFLIVFAISMIFQFSSLILSEMKKFNSKNENSFKEN